MSNHSNVLRSEDQQMAHVEDVALIPMCFHYTRCRVARDALKEVCNLVGHGMRQDVWLLVLGGNSADSIIEDRGVNSFAEQRVSESALTLGSRGVSLKVKKDHSVWVSSGGADAAVPGESNIGARQNAGSEDF